MYRTRAPEALTSRMYHNACREGWHLSSRQASRGISFLGRAGMATAACGSLLASLQARTDRDGALSAGGATGPAGASGNPAGITSAATSCAEIAGTTGAATTLSASARNDGRWQQLENFESDDAESEAETGCAEVAGTTGTATTLSDSESDDAETEAETSGLPRSMVDRNSEGSRRTTLNPSWNCVINAATMTLISSRISHGTVCRKQTTHNHAD